ncbi:hypothetical protein AB0L25_18770 [Spirillospora sp. NPDC052242]
MPFANSHEHDPSPARPGALVNAALGAVFALGIAFTAYMLAVSWGGAYWVPTSGIAAALSGLALLRGRRRTWPAAAGVGVAAAAVGVSATAGLPQEPSPVAALALAVLVGSALRTLPAPAAVAVAAGGVAVAALGWVTGPGGVTALAAVILAGGVVTGPLLRVLAPVRPSGGGRRPGGPPVP